ncbi:hypothetical protein GTR04_4430 [Trichophyton interdigitale]|uniref:Uncharacterized protein n=1 Tax=Trichophyton interdigitale TaxID=101480 RepID=A0A9P5CV55_9EURO|nr:hypothetical protein GY632_4085 [Trichophyton interdigitale]KAG8208180.1 hypothetical protein GTR04_4430 [Trichophyton interdigitale]
MEGVLRGIRCAAVVTAVALLQLLALRPGGWLVVAVLQMAGRAEIRRRRLVGWATRKRQKEQKEQKEGDE